ncbi:sodium:proton antiporter [Lottiidibacillus patelloidae]|uniref:Sodium:proton antiporter n=1 Tax=Lottiidibacillus patelloidae TaxID=2670334 RepID=A0A263BRL8_9BACI|nr:cation:proton antiporter family protein [Lottiidibacillus patelloidae]OZM56349.1 sodium:proton antiporter [Lottiidibacillus patelloidae]
MMEHVSLFSLMFVVGIAFFVPILLHKFNLNMIPVVVAEIIAGLIIGKSGLNIISEDVWLSLISTLGFIFLMFLSGLEIDFSMLESKNKKQKFNPLLIATIIFSLMFGLSYGLSVVLENMGLIEDAFFMTLIISTISLGVVVPVLKEKGIMDSLYGQTLLLIATVSDFLTMILLAVYVMVKHASGFKSLSILLLFVVMFVTYRSVKKYFKLKFFDHLMSGTIQLGTRGVFALILIFVSLSETLGAESILGAFLAGMIVSLINPKKTFIKQLDSFGYGFFIPIFFVMVGVNMDLKALLSDKKSLIIIPILLIVLYISKILPSLLLKKWFPWKKTLSSGILLTSTLSLVIAAVEIGKEMDVVSEQMGNSAILVAIITCIISPILFNKLTVANKRDKKKVTIIGANRITLPVSLDLQKHDGYEVRMFGSEQSKVEPEMVSKKTQFPLIEVPKLTCEALNMHNAFDADMLIVATGNDDDNITIAHYAKEIGLENVIIRVEDAQKHKEQINEGMNVFSTLFAARTLLKALTLRPSILKLFTYQNDLLREISVGNSKYDDLQLRQIPFLGDALVIQIFRDEEPIVPHGDTRLKLGDKLLASGSKENLDDLAKELQ